jgi:3-dehydroquinate dehydratase-1
MICISIQEKHRGKAISLANAAKLAEIRIDLSNFNEKDVAFVFSKADSQLIATCRPAYIADKERINLLKTAIANGAAYVDVEIESSQEVKKTIIPYAKAHNCKCIVSYHNFNDTPQIDELEEIIEACFALDADIVKIATTAKTMQDSARILSLYQTNRPLVALAMGDLGKITRIANITLGSPFTFVAAHKESLTAQGQLTLEQMNNIFRIYNYSL